MSEIPAQPQQSVPGAALVAAEARRSGALEGLRRDLDSSDRSWQATLRGLMGSGAPPAIREQQQQQFEQGRAAIVQKIEEAEGLAGWDLVTRYASEWSRPAAEPDPHAWKDGLARGSMLPRQQVGATPEMVDPSYLAQYQARRADWQHEDQAAAAARARQLAG